MDNKSKKYILESPLRVLYPAALKRKIYVVSHVILLLGIGIFAAGAEQGKFGIIIKLLWIMPTDGVIIYIGWHIFNT